MTTNNATQDLIESASIPKCPTGIRGLDEITGGGLPQGRPTLVCGGPGCGKTVLAMEFLVHGALNLGEPGLFVSFEETPQNLASNFRSFGVDIDDLIASKRLKITHVDVSRWEIVESGSFSLDPLMIRLEHSITEIGAKRLVLDTMENLFAALSNSEILRNEVARLFHWLRDRGIACIVTGEKGKEDLTRHGFEEYISDCVLLLDHRVTEQISQRRLRVVKYRGSAHCKDENPFLIGATGISVFPITSVALDNDSPTDRVSTGIEGLDAMLGGKGYYRGASVLVSGKAGTGKSTLAAAFAAASCERGERCLYLSFEESATQVTRNMRSVGIDLGPWLTNGLLTLQAFRPSFRGIEEHLVATLDTADRVQPASVVLDPITNFVSVGAADEVRSMLTRVFDHFKGRGITLLLIALTAGSGVPDETETRMSSLMDTWIALDLQPVDHTHRRELHIIKSRGMAHSHDTSELVFASDGLSLRDVAKESL